MHCRSIRLRNVRPSPGISFCVFLMKRQFRDLYSIVSIFAELSICDKKGGSSFIAAFKSQIESLHFLGKHFCKRGRPYAYTILLHSRCLREDRMPLRIEISTYRGIFINTFCPINLIQILTSKAATS